MLDGELAPFGRYCPSRALPAKYMSVTTTSSSSLRCQPLGVVFSQIASIALLEQVGAEHEWMHCTSTGPSLRSSCSELPCMPIPVAVAFVVLHADLPAALLLRTRAPAAGQYVVRGVIRQPGAAEVVTEQLVGDLYPSAGAGAGSCTSTDRGARAGLSRPPRRVPVPRLG